MLGIAGHRHTPVERGARHGEIPQASAHEVLHLVGAGVGANKFRVRLVMGQQPILERRQLEEVTLLLDPLHRRALGRKLGALGTVLQLALVVKGLIPHGVPAGIFAEIDIAGLLHAPP